MKKNNFIVTTLNGMAYGLFATLIIGTIIGTIAKLFQSGSEVSIFINTSLNGLSSILSIITGAGIGIGIALSLKFDTLKTITLGVVGETASYFSLTTGFVTGGTLNNTFKVGDPLTIYLVCIVVALLISLICKKQTKVDIILIPLLGSVLGLIFSLLIRYPSIYVTYGIQYIVNIGTNTVPFIAGIIVSVAMGMALTAPISSAAIAAMVFTLPAGISITDPSVTGLVLASGAAIVGCSTQMVGFAIQSIYDNKAGTVISVGIGTSMLQFKNIVKKPVVWLPTIIASAILGPIATCILKTVCMGSAAGMGTAGLVGQIGTIASMGTNNINTWLSIILLELLLPALLVFLIDLLFRKLGWIKKGDLTI